MRITPKIRKAVNKHLALLVYNTYFDSLPLTKVANILIEYGLNTDGMEGIYCGHEGRSTSLVADNSMICMQWYRMGSGRFEFNAYLS